MVIVRSYPFHRLQERTPQCLQGEYVGSESKTIVSVLCEIKQQVTLWLSRCVEIAIVKSVAVFGLHLPGGELILVTHIFEYDKVIGVKRCPAESSLVKQVLCHEYYTDFLMVPALGEEIPSPSNWPCSADRPTQPV